MYHRITHFNHLALILIFTMFGIDSTYAASVQISGLLETHIGSDTDYDGVTSSDIIQATVELGIDAEISEWVSGHVLLLYEDDGDLPLDVDEANIMFGNDFLSAFSLTVGLQYVPFGFFETNMVSDPLTLEIGETADSAVSFAYDDVVNISFYLFNGDVILNDGDQSDEKIGNYGINFGYIFEADDFVLDFGVGYINSLAESFGLTDTINAEPEAGSEDPGTGGAGIENLVGGVASHVFIEWGNFIFITDHVFATDEFASQEIKFGAKAKPSALNVELALSISEDATIAIGIQQSVDSVGLGLPESRALLALSYGLGDATAIGVELSQDTDYSEIDGGTGQTATAIGLHVAAEF